VLEAGDELMLEVDRSPFRRCAGSIPESVAEMLEIF
jgi:hypothetical protein